ncbi:hypothetical protein WN943_011808 [Citrus x changshan-huyou]
MVHLLASKPRCGNLGEWSPPTRGCNAWKILSCPLDLINDSFVSVLTLTYLSCLNSQCLSNQRADTDLLQNEGARARDFQFMEANSRNA